MKDLRVTICESAVVGIAEFGLRVERAKLEKVVTETEKSF